MEYFIIGERSSTIRMLARNALSGYWITGVIVMFIAHVILITIPEILEFAAGYIGEFIGAVFLGVIAGPIYLGIAIFTLELVRGKDPEVAHLFYGFERFGTALGVFWLVALKVFLWALIAAPFAIATFIAISNGNYMLAAMMIMLIVPACIPAIIVAYRYVQVYYILADDPEVGVFECLERSKIIMTGNKLKHFVLLLTFFGWAILASLPGLPVALMFELGGSQPTLFSIVVLSIVPWIAIFFVEAYVWTSLAVFYEMVVGNLRPAAVQQESTQMPNQLYSTNHEQASQISIQESEQAAQNSSQTAKFEETQGFSTVEKSNDNVRQKEQEK